MTQRDTRGAEGSASVVERSEAEKWRRMVAEQVTSGLSQDEFCSQLRVSPGRFRYWKYTKLAQLPAEDEGQAEPLSAAASLVPVRVVGRSEPENWRTVPQERGSSGVQVLLTCGLRICLERGFDGSVLREAVEVLGC